MYKQQTFMYKYFLCLVKTFFLKENYKFNQMQQICFKIPRKATYTEVVGSNNDL